jgi:hypothetical protein
MSSADQLKGFDSLAKYAYTEILEQNLIAFFDWGLINKGGFTNINISTSGTYGGDFSRLRPVSDPRYSSGQVWESAKRNWVWESGLETSTQPISISGVFVGQTFYPNSGGQFYIDYPNGRVIFNSGISQTSNVKVAYSFKWVNVCSADNIPWLRKVQSNTYRVDNSNFLIGSGDYIPLSQSRVDLPTVAIEISDETYAGFSIGGGHYCNNKVKFHIVTEDKSSADRLGHVIASQEDKQIFIYDANRMAEDNRFPLDYRGSIASGALTYPQLTRYSGEGGYRLNEGLLAGKVSLLNSQVQQFQRLTGNVGRKTVSLNVESVLTKV